MFGGDVYRPHFAHTSQPKYDMKRLVDAGGKDLAKLKDLAEAQEADNELDYQRRAKDKVTYGEPIQLYHVATRRYLRISSTNTTRLEPRWAIMHMKESAYSI
jgi:hypothetical protein